MKYSDVNFGAIELNGMGSKPKKFDNNLCYAFIWHKAIDPEDSKTTHWKQLEIKTDPIKLTKGGIPMLDSEREKRGWKTKGIFRTDADRNFIKIGLDLEQLSCHNLKSHLMEADNYFQSDKVKKELFGKKADRCIYCPIVRDKSDYCPDDESVENDVKPYKPNDSSFKVKFNFGEKYKPVIKKNGVLIENINNMTDLCRWVKYNSQFSITFAYTSIWFAPHQKNQYTYGVSLRAKEIDLGSYYEPYPKVKSINLSEIKMAYTSYLNEIKKGVSTNAMEIII
jgi:hypothetical protein